MPFDSGSVSFTICRLPQALPDNVLERFAEFAAPPLTGTMEEPVFGWVTGRHLLDTDINDHTALAGGYVHLSLRSAQRKIPSALFKAECRMRELQLMEAKQFEFLTRRQRQDIKAQVQEELLRDMPPTLAGIPFVLDAPMNLLYLGATSPKQIDRFCERFLETMGFAPIPLSPGLASEYLFGLSVEMLYPLSFSGMDRHADEERVPGRDFATWLWFFQEMETGTFTVDELGEFSIAIDGPLLFAADGTGALESAMRKGAPTISAEAKAALTIGKKLKQAKFMLVRDKELWTFTLDADAFSFRSVSLPPGENLDAHSHFQERIMFINIFHRVFFHLYERFCTQVSERGTFDELESKVQAWVTNLDSR